MPWILQTEERGCYRTLFELITTDIPGYRTLTRMEPAFFYLIEERITISGSQPPTSGSYWKSGWNWQLHWDTYPHEKATLHCSSTGGLEERPSANLSLLSAKPFWKNFMCPIEPEDWKKIEERFRNRWNVPHAVCASPRSQVVNISTTRATSPWYFRL